MHLNEYARRLLARRSSPEDPLPIVQAGHPVLRRPARDAVGALDDDLLDAVVRAMVITMREAPGVGLAAPQIGLPLRLFVAEDRYQADVDPDVDPADDPLERRPFDCRTFLDPQYEEQGATQVFAFEGCLSVDGWCSIRPRCRAIVFEGTERSADGSLHPVREEHVGWPARILQHETDHLAGILCHDHAVPRSFMDQRYQDRYADLSDAVTELGLVGDITRLAPGQVHLAR